MGARTNGVCVLKISRGVALDQFLRDYQFSTRVQGDVQHRVVYDLFIGYRGP